MGILINYTDELTGIKIENAYVNIINIKINKNKISGYYDVFSSYENRKKTSISTNYFEFEHNILSKDKIDIYDVTYKFLKDEKLKDVFVADKQDDAQELSL